MIVDEDNDLPLVIAEVDRVAGIDAALKLAFAKGGQNVYIPFEPSEHHWLTLTVGLEAARKICEHYRVGKTGARLLIPLARTAMQRRRLIEALQAGRSLDKAAATSGMHRRTAIRMRKRIKEQGDLF